MLPNTVRAWHRGGGCVAFGTTTWHPGEVLGLVSDRMRAFGADLSVAAVERRLLKGPGSLAVAVSDDHTDHDVHLDLDFILNIHESADTTGSLCMRRASVLDCGGGDPGTVLAFRGPVDALVKFSPQDPTMFESDVNQSGRSPAREKPPQVSGFS